LNSSQISQQRSNNPLDNLQETLNKALPQTQCQQCGYLGCAPYAQALAERHAEINRCPPGGQEGMAKLAKILNRPIPATIDPEYGAEGPRFIAYIQAEQCIGCTLCIQACPVDAIAGVGKRLHAVLEDWCTGCGLCLPPCPVDCIEMKPINPHLTGWAAWSQEQADLARQRHARHQQRLQREPIEQAARHEELALKKLATVITSTTDNHAEIQEKQRKQAIIEAAIARARALRKTANPS
jgi:Na+-translocating ferredoxin:NAD+ oxidoreductase subunit B